jgi:hypothetical protein
MVGQKDECAQDLLKAISSCIERNPMALGHICGVLF